MDYKLSAQKLLALPLFAQEMGGKLRVSNNNPTKR